MFLFKYITKHISYVFSGYYTITFAPQWLESFGALCRPLFGIGWHRVSGLSFHLVRVANILVCDPRNHIIYGGYPYVCFIQRFEKVSIFAKLDERILTAFKKLDKANIKAHNIDVRFISCILIINLLRCSRKILNQWCNVVSIHCNIAKFNVVRVSVTDF